LSALSAKSHFMHVSQIHCHTLCYASNNVLETKTVAIAVTSANCFYW